MYRFAMVTAFACALSVILTVKIYKRPDLIRPLAASIPGEISPLHAHLRFNPHGIAPDSPQP